MFVIGICKNDPYALEDMRKLIVNYLNERQIRNIVKAYQNENDYFEDKLKFDLLFIEMNFFNTSKISNIDVKTKIVYISNQAHKLKNKIHTSSQENTEHIYQIINEIINLNNIRFALPSLVIKTDFGVKIIHISDIIYVEIKRNLLLVVAENYKQQGHGSLSYCFNILKQYGFAMPHKSYIINLNNVTGIVGYNVFLNSNIQIPLSQKRSVQFRMNWKQYIIEKY